MEDSIVFEKAIGVLAAVSGKSLEKKRLNMAFWRNFSKVVSRLKSCHFYTSKENTEFVWPYFRIEWDVFLKKLSVEEVILPDKEDFAKSAKKQTFFLALLVENPFLVFLDFMIRIPSYSMWACLQCERWSDHCFHDISGLWFFSWNHFLREEIQISGEKASKVKNSWNFHEKALALQFPFHNFPWI